MANDVSNALKTAYRRFYQNMAAQDVFWRKVTDAIIIDDPNYTESDIYGLTTYSATSESPTYRELKSSASTSNLADFEQIVKVKFKDARDIPTLIPQLGAELGRLAALTLDNAFITALTTLDVTTHPENGGSVYEAQSGGTVYYCDAFTIYPPNASSFNQQNLFTDGLSRSALSDALNARWKYRDKAGNRIDSRTKPYLITSSDATTDAIDILALTGPTYDGTGLVSGSFRDRIAAHIPLPGPAADANDWWLIWTETEVDDQGKQHRRCPIMPLIRGEARISFQEDPGSHYLFAKGYFEYTIHYSTFEGNIQMHKVA